MARHGQVHHSQAHAGPASRHVWLFHLTQVSLLGQAWLTESDTTREPREGEVRDVHYHYVTREEFERLIAAGEFIEWAKFSNNLYGTTIKAVQDVAQEQARKCILDIDMQGVKLVKKTNLNARYLFIAPPSFEELERRLRGRGTESEEAIQARLEQAKQEMAYAQEPGSHDLVVVNDDLEKAYKQVEEFCLSN